MVLASSLTKPNSRGGIRTRTRETPHRILSQDGDCPKTSNAEDLRQTQSGCAAPGAAVGAENAPIDPDLQSIIERWPELPDAVKADIVAMVRAEVG